MQPFVQQITNYENKPTSNVMLDSIRNDTCRRSMTYKEMNPLLSCHQLYRQKSTYIPDSLRINFTRLRLSSHKLRVETGRWSHTPREKRICSCGSFQDEKHVLECKHNTEILREFGYKDGHVGLQKLFNNLLNTKHLTMLSKLVDNCERQR